MLRRPTAAACVALAVLGAACSTSPSPVADAPQGPASPSTAPPASTSPSPQEPGTGEVAAGDEIVEAAPVATERVWVRVEAGIDDALLTDLAALPGVLELRSGRGDDVPLWGSSLPDGTPVDDFADGFKVDVDVTVAEADAPLAPSAGEVLLTATGAARRDLVVGSTVVLGTERTTLRVADVVDAEEFGGAELVVGAVDAAALGIEPRQRASLLVDPDVDAEQLEPQVVALVGQGDGTAVRVREVRDRAFILGLAGVKDVFGEFAFRDVPGERDVVIEQAWVEQNIEVREVPLLGSIRCHRAVFDDVVAALEQVRATGLADSIDPRRYGGCWTPRRISPSGNLSKHAWGIALDINVDFSVPGGGEVPPDGVIEAFEANGFRWGGDFPTPDNHHFEWVGGR